MTGAVGSQEVKTLEGNSGDVRERVFVVECSESRHASPISASESLPGTRVPESLRNRLEPTWVGSQGNLAFSCFYLVYRKRNKGTTKLSAL
jgi:hypothetical protein